MIRTLAAAALAATLATTLTGCGGGDANAHPGTHAAAQPTDSGDRLPLAATTEPILNVYAYVQYMAKGDYKDACAFTIVTEPDGTQAPAVEQPSTDHPQGYVSPGCTKYLATKDGPWDELAKVDVNDYQTLPGPDSTSVGVYLGEPGAQSPMFLMGHPTNDPEWYQREEPTIPSDWTAE